MDVGPAEPLHPDRRLPAKFRESEISNLKFQIQQVVGVRGVEPRTLRLSSACSNQLSYTPRIESEIRNPNLNLVELRRLELPTYSLQSYRSTN